MSNQLSDKSSIYMIVHGPTAKFYIGCTIQKLNIRLSMHFANARAGRKCPLYRLMEEFNFDKKDFSIDLLETVDFVDGKNVESNWIRLCIDDPNCLNKRIEHRSEEEQREIRKIRYLIEYYTQEAKDSRRAYYQLNKEAIIQKAKKYYEKHRTEILLKMKDNYRRKKELVDLNEVELSV